MATLAGKRADVYVTAGAPVALVNEVMQDIAASGFAARTTYQVTNQVKRYLDTVTALVIQQSLDSGATWNPVVPDTVAPGYVQFIAPRQAAPLAQIRVASGAYLPYARVGGGSEWTLTPGMILLDRTEFGMNSKQFLPAGLTEGTVDIKRWWQDNTMKASLGNLVVLVLYLNATAQPVGARYEVFASMHADALKVGAKILETEDMKFSLQSQPAYLAA